MELQEVRDRIMQVPLCKSLPAPMQGPLVAGLLGLASTRDARKGSFLYLQGARDPDTGCLLLRGSVEVRKENEPPIIVNAPDVLGEMQLFTPLGRRTATVEMASDGTVLEFSWHDFAQLARRLFDKQERDVLKRAVADCAWRRDPNLFSH